MLATQVHSCRADMGHHSCVIYSCYKHGSAGLPGSGCAYIQTDAFLPGSFCRVSEYLPLSFFWVQVLQVALTALGLLRRKNHWRHKMTQSRFLTQELGNIFMHLNQENDTQMLRHCSSKFLQVFGLFFGVVWRSYEFGHYVKNWRREWCSEWYPEVWKAIHPFFFFFFNCSSCKFSAKVACSNKCTQW